jgi:hypothetical protein
MVAVDRERLSRRSHFIENLGDSLTISDGVPDGPGAVSILDDSVRRRHATRVFDKYTVGCELGRVARQRAGWRTGARFDLHWDQLIGSVNEVIRFPAQAYR